MKRLLGHLRRTLHILPTHIGAFVSSDTFADAVCNATDEMKARLTIRVLDGISLCPLTYTDQFDGETLLAEANGTPVTFFLRFHCWVNFIGSFSLSMDSTLRMDVLAAIDRNLASQMFKAATLDRRIDRRRVRLETQAGKRFQERHRAMQDKFGRGYESNPAAQTAVTDANTRHNDRISAIQERCRAVSEKASPGFSGSFSESVAGFLYRELPGVATTGGLKAL